MAISVKLSGVSKEFGRLDSELTEFVNMSTRSKVITTVGELKRVTPVDTGRARNSWLATKSSSEYISTTGFASGVSNSLLSPPSKKAIETFFITNGVRYIDLLNAGSSRQAPSRFIENTILKHFDIDSIVYSTEK